MAVADPTDTGVATVIRAVALAATKRPERDPQHLAAQAAHAGLRAAARGVAIPLPVLLDVHVLWLSREPDWKVLRSSAAPSAASRAYDRWLQQFCARCRLWSGGSSSRRSSGATEWDILPALCSAWSVNGRSVADYGRAYKWLSDRPSQDLVVKMWSGPRETTVASFERLVGETPTSTTPTLAGGLWSTFATPNEAAWLDATFDHEAARMYLRAEDPEITHDQQRRITRLKHRRPSFEPSRAPTAYEEPNPYAGAVMLSTLVLDEVGDHLIANHADIRFANNPPARPPHPIDIHLHWALGAAGLETSHPAPVFGDESVGARACEASMLQGVVALLFDDWRSALRELPVYFHAHCGAPQGGADEFGTGGPRWKPGPTGADPLPPVGAIRRFFSRCDWSRLGACGLEPHYLEAGGLRCLVALRSDLVELGFVEMPREHDDAPITWRVGRMTSLERVAMVLVIESAEGDAALCRMTSVDGDMRLVRVRVPHRPQGAPDPSFAQVRRAALDQLLDTLDRFMR